MLLENPYCGFLRSALFPPPGFSKKLLRWFHPSGQISKGLGQTSPRASETQNGLVEDDAISSASQGEKGKSCEPFKYISRIVWVAPERDTCFATKGEITNTIFP